MKFRNFKLVGYVIFGRGAFNQVDEIIAPHRKGDAPMIFFVDHFFEGNQPFNKRIPGFRRRYRPLHFLPHQPRLDG